MPNRGAYGNARWFKTSKNRDVSTGPLTRVFAHSLAPFTHSLALHCSAFALLTCSAVPVCLLAHSRTHYGTKPGQFETSKIHFPTSEGVSEVNERANE